MAKCEIEVKSLLPAATAFAKASVSQELQGMIKFTKRLMSNPALPGPNLHNRTLARPIATIAFRRPYSTVTLLAK